jgi:hypothetical protein
MKLSYIILSVFILFVSQVIGQGKQSEEVTIIFKGNRQIESSFRISEDPKLIDTVIPFPEVNYPLLSLRYNTLIQVDTIQAAKLKLVDKLPEIYPGYVKAGIGSVFMPLAEVHYNSTRSRKYIYGANYKHVSSWGNIKGYAPAKFARNSLNAFGGINEKNYTARGDFHLNNRGLHWYGFPDENADRDSINNRFNDVGTRFAFESHKKDSLNVNYKIGLELNRFTDKKSKVDSLELWRARENYVAVNAGAWYKKGKEIFAVDLSLRANSYQYGERDTSISLYDTAIYRNNAVISLKPSITTFAFDNKLKAHIGVDVTIDAGAQSKAYIYPIAEFKYSLFDDIFIPYAGVKGGLKQNTIRGFSQENEFILSNLALRNEHNALTGYAGFKGTITKEIGFDINGRFSHVKDKALFVNDTTYTAGNRFTVIYDTMNIATIEGSLFYQMSEKIKIDAIGRFNSYQARNNIFAWNLPQIHFIARGHYNLYDKFIFNLDFCLEGGRRAKVYQAGTGIFEEDGQFAKTLGFIADFNLGVEYRYTKRISAFIQFNNFTAQRYQRWMNYPVQGFQVMGGATFRF